ncbi:uroporphyrinogen-III synthase [Qipengyuania marisflavi]|uniref:Uroporphyrinogen-III synthase n=1 Tax=Qipengyuania marisflavi TaxID=2486356 RepID=A0A5S3PCD1_9SPHN|nr:uroporphyrinogen-III synthase [Qipengyuania marisflavi]TMM50415.1 uroporphyrinogen-III synthase [Qipengyuania marisflavi]
MSRPLFVFRPEPGWTATAVAARALGLNVFGHPLFVIEPAAWQCPAASNYNGVLIGSANVLRHGGDQLAALTNLPVYAVGQTTANAARTAGFTVAQTGVGGLQALLDTLGPEPLTLLRLAGEARVALTPPSHITVATQVVYRAAPLPLDPACSSRLDGAVAVVHSGEAARRLRSECERLGIARGNTVLLALAPRIAEMAGSGWHSVQIAETADEGDLLALAQALCQNI